VTVSELAAPQRAASWTNLFCGQPETLRARSDLACFLVVIASFAVGLGVSWQRWGNPVVDSGRELNLPLRLVHGEMLYSDVGYMYGPLSPYLNALLYRIFHPSLWVLWSHGIFCTIVILALSYWLARQVSGRFAAVLACLLVTWVCALKSQGNYMLPYAFGGLDGSMFVLACTAASIVSLRKKSIAWAVTASLLASLAVLSKTEFGAAALVVCVVTAVLAGYGRLRFVLYWLVPFLVPAASVPALVYGWFASRVGWRVLTVDNHLFFGHVPWQLLYFNGYRFGFDRPWHSLSLMIASLIRLIAFGGLLASVAIFIERRRNVSVDANAGAGSPTKNLVLFGFSILGIALTSAVTSDLGPLMAMPFILVGLVGVALIAFAQAARQVSVSAQLNAGTVVILATSALACLPRILFRVSTGGALTSFLLPGSVVLFVYVWLVIFPSLVPEARARQRARQMISAILMVGLLATAVTLCVRYRRKFSYPWATPRGTWVTSPDLGIAFTQGLRFMEEKTAPGDAVAVLPEGTSLDFVSDRRNPLHDEIVTPGFLDAEGEARAIQALRNSRTPLIFVANRATPEFAQPSFGKDYDQHLMSWIEQNYTACGVFGSSQDPNLEIGNPVFFLRAYCLSHIGHR
jgi:hypothetical protein